MTTAPFEPDPEPGDERIAAADAGRGAPPPAPGFGEQAEEPDRTEDDGAAANGAAEEGVADDGVSRESEDRDERHTRPPRKF